MKKKNIIALSFVVASGILVLSGCKRGKGTTTTAEITESETTETKEQITITFVSNCEYTMDPMTGYADEALELPVPGRDGYTFKGWYLDLELTKACTLTKMPAEDMTLYAKWEANTYKISFDMAGADPMDAIYFDYGEEIILPEVAQREGYTFLGWDREVPSLMPDESFTLTALWQKNTYTVTFIYGNGEADETIAYSYGDVISYPEPVWEGYTFLGWNGGSTAFEMPAENLTYTASWRALSYSITYDLDGGILEDKTESYTIEDEVILGTPVKTGYTFKGWYLDSEYETSVTSIEKGTTGDLTLYAEFEINSYAITYNLDGGTLENKTLAYTVEDEVSLGTPVKEGYAFLGWYTDSEYETSITSIEKGTTGDLTLYAKFLKNVYTITFDTDGGSEVDSLSLSYLDVVTAPENPVKTGYTFLGWDQEIPSVMPAESLTIKALWSINSYTIAFDSDGGTAVSSITADYNTEITAPENPKKTGYTFLGWSPEIPSVMPAEDITLKALWSVNTYTITFDTNGGEAMEAVSYSYGQAIGTVSDPVREGHTFTGWDQEIPSVMPAEDITLKASWSINTYTITFDTNGGEAMESITYNYGDSISLEAPLRSGYVFTGWDSEVPETMPAENLTLKASWREGSYSVTYILGGKATYSGETSFTGTATLTLSDPVVTADGYLFDGWFSDSSYKNQITTVAGYNDESITVYAKISAYVIRSKTDVNGLDYALLYKHGIYDITLPSVMDGVTLTDVYSVTGSVPSGYTGFKIIIPEGFEYISSYAFYELSALTFVVIPSTVTYIGDYAFAGTGITSVEIPQAITSIGGNLFEGCTSLETVTLLGEITQIYEDAFKDCSSLYVIYMEQVGDSFWSSISTEYSWDSGMPEDYVVYLYGKIVDKYSEKVCHVIIHNGNSDAYDTITEGYYKKGAVLQASDFMSAESGTAAYIGDKGIIFSGTTTSYTITSNDINVYYTSVDLYVVTR